MCGLCGIAGADVASLSGRLEPIIASLAHRGPDGEGRYTAPSRGCVLGHRRLSVIDLGAGSAQPMSSPDGRRVLAYNGELYNFRELREELVRGGTRFRTQGDTEVVLEALSTWGEDSLPRFNGMFALAFWDEDKKRLLLARDRFGQKPLYFARHAGNLVFASEVRSILESGLVERRVDLDALRGFLCYGSVPGPGTIVRGVRSLEAGHVLSWSAADGERSRSFWNPGREKRELGAGELREVLQKAVQRHLVSDVPIGVFLSGGLDSASISALATSPGKPARTFTLVFPNEPAQGEAAEARETARHLGTAHTEVGLSAEGIRESLDLALRSQDQPSGDGLNTWLVARAARAAGLTVALSGLGSDELFGGYGTFREVPRMARIRAMAGPLSGLLSGAASFASAASPRRAGRIADLLRAPSGLIPAYLIRRRVLSSQQIRQLAPGIAEAGWTPGVAEERLSRLASRIEGLADEDAVAVLELDLYMGDTLLRDADAMGMAHALEIRMPFLDTVVADAALALAAAWRRPDPAPKRALLAAMAPLLPPSLPGRLKRGFTLPLSDWMRGDLCEEVEQGIEALAALGAPFDGKAVRALWQDFCRRPAGVGWYRPWMLYVLGRYLAINRLALA